MFTRARARLTLLYIGLFALVLALFSLGFYLAIATVLAPDFDIGPEVTTEQAAGIAYRATIEQIAVALVVADVVVLLVVSVCAWLLAGRTLDPIREAHLAQRRFVADASHEMRSPIAAIRSSAEAALSGDGGEAELRRSLASVVEGSERLSRITTDLLLLARADDGTLHPRREPFDLSVLAAETLEEARATRGEGRTEGQPDARLELAPDLVVEADREDIRRALGNLLDNAFRYGNPAGRVLVRTRAADRTAIIEVADDGPGIAAADLRRIFEPFYRVRADAEAPTGTGLGLAIVANLARRNGGRVAVDSRPGMGSTFRIVLPRTG